MKSEVELEAGLLPGIPVRIKGTVVTTASLKVVSADEFDLQIQNTHVTGSNLPILNQFLDSPRFDLPVKDVYQTLTGSVPTIPMKTYYMDEGMRIVRDVDENFFVFTRA